MTAAANPPAFPIVLPTGYEFADNGMSLRDWFAGQALVGLLASGSWSNVGDGFEAFIATKAHNIADAMLAERERKS